MSKNRYLNTKFWDDKYIIDLDPIEKLMFLYFLTNPLTNISGIYEISLKRISFDTGIDKDMVLKILDRFEKNDKIKYQNGWIAIKNFIKNQKQSDNKNDNINKGIQKELINAPDYMLNWIEIDTPLKGHENQIDPLELSEPISEYKHEYKAEIELIYPSDDYKSIWLKWIQFKKDQFKFTYKTKQSEQLALNELIKISNNDYKTAEIIINKSITNGWKGLFELKGNDIIKPEKAKIQYNIPQHLLDAIEPKIGG